MIESNENTVIQKAMVFQVQVDIDQLDQWVLQEVVLVNHYEMMMALPKNERKYLVQPTIANLLCLKDTDLRKEKLLLVKQPRMMVKRR